MTFLLADNTVDETNLNSILYTDSWNISLDKSVNAFLRIGSLAQQPYACDKTKWNCALARNVFSSVVTILPQLNSTNPFISHGTQGCDLHLNPELCCSANQAPSSQCFAPWFPLIRMAVFQVMSTYMFFPNLTVPAIFFCKSLGVCTDVTERIHEVLFFLVGIVPSCRHKINVLLSDKKAILLL